MLVITVVSTAIASMVFLGMSPDPAVRGVVRLVQPSHDEVIASLVEGNDRFVKGTRRFARLNKDRVVATAQAQEPYATFLACSDSRVPIEHVFDAGIGDLFVVRVAGNVCSDHEIGSIEYGVEHLNTPLVVVLGHTHCGAVTAVVESAHVRGKFPHLAEHILPAYQDAMARRMNNNEASVIHDTVRSNVRKAMRDLVGLSEGIRARIANGGVKVVGAIYNLNTGEVEWLSEEG